MTSLDWKAGAVDKRRRQQYGPLIMQAMPTAVTIHTTANNETKQPARQYISAFLSQQFISYIIPALSRNQINRLRRDLILVDWFRFAE
jgi:hypothetical protein